MAAFLSPLDNCRARRGVFAALLAIAALLHPVAAAAQSAGRDLEHQVKAAFIFNFAQFIDWPEARRSATTIVLCILDPDPFGDSMDALHGRRQGNVTMQVRHIARPNDVAGCDMLFVPDAQTSRLASILQFTKGRRIVTIGESDGAAARSFIINLYVEQNKVRFAINVDALARSGLTMSSQLLRLARIVHDRN